MRGILQGQGGKRYKTNQITGLTATVGWATANTVKLTWTNPTDVNFKGIVIRYKAGSYPTSPTDGYSFYDSYDATPAATYTVTGANIVDGTTFYFRAFAYSYIGATKVFNTSTTGAQATGTPYRAQGTQIFTASGTFVVPYGVNAIDVFLVGGGGAGSSTQGAYVRGGGGGGGGGTISLDNLSVSAGQSIPVTVGSGGSPQSIANALTVDPGSGGNSTVVVGGATHTANGGIGGGRVSGIAYPGKGGNGGSGGGQGSQSTTYAGGTDGVNGYSYDANTRGIGQGVTTKSFAEVGGTLYSGGGGGGGASDYYTVTGGLGGAGGGANGGNVVSGTNQPGGSASANTGGGGGGGSADTEVSGISGGTLGGSGGSGIVIIRWGY